MYALRVLQSPMFRLQRKLESRIKDMRGLNSEIASLEQDKQELQCNEQALVRKVSKLGKRVNNVYIV